MRFTTLFYGKLNKCRLSLEFDPFELNDLSYAALRIDFIYADLKLKQKHGNIFHKRERIF